jgi:hypothetical protein
MSDPGTEQASGQDDQAPEMVQAPQTVQTPLEGASADGTWRYRTGETPGEVVFSTDGGEEHALELTGGPVLEVRELERPGEVLVRTVRFEHTLVREPRGDRWRVIMTRREE